MKLAGEALRDAHRVHSLIEAAERSRQCLAWVEPLIPAGLRRSVRHGPLQDGQWCLLAANSATAAKLRQLVPALASALRSRGEQVSAIRVKVQAAGTDGLR